jgi:hypothetical protein
VAFSLPYILPTDEWPILQRAVAAAILFVLAYGAALVLDRVLSGRQRS